MHSHLPKHPANPPFFAIPAPVDTVGNHPLPLLDLSSNRPNCRSILGKPTIYVSDAGHEIDGSRSGTMPLKAMNERVTKAVFTGNWKRLFGTCWVRRCWSSWQYSFDPPVHDRQRIMQ